MDIKHIYCTSLGVQAERERVTVQASQKTLHATMEDRLQSTLVQCVCVGVLDSDTKTKNQNYKHR